MADLAKLVVSLEAETAKYRRELEKANKRLNRFARSQKKGLDIVKQGFRGLAGIVAGVSFSRIIRDSINTADNFAKLNDRLGIGVAALSELTFAADRAGVSERQFSLGIQRLSRRVAEAAVGLGEAKGALKELGLDAASLTKLPLEDQFTEVSEALSNVATASDRTRLAFKLFDSEGVALLQLTKDGAAGLELMRQKARDLGVSFTDDMAQQAVDAKDALTDMDAAITGLANRMTTLLAPAITSVAEAFTSLFQETEQEALSELIEKRTNLINLLAETAEGNPQRERIEQEIRGIGFQIELIETKIERREEETAELQKQLDLIKEITVEAKKRTTDFDFIEPLSIESNLDRILRPGVTEDVERKERSFSALGETIEEVEQSGIDLGFTFQSAFEDAIIEGENLRSVMKGLLDDILRILLRTTITGPLGDFFGGLFGGFGGARAAGGPVSAGSAYLVGERGPELFVPRASGTIVPNGAGGVQVNTSLNISGQNNLTPATLLPILEENNRRVKADVLDALDRGTLR